MAQQVEDTPPKQERRHRRVARGISILLETIEEKKLSKKDEEAIEKLARGMCFIWDGLNG